MASNAACTLTQIGHTPGGMAKLVTHPDNRRFGLAIAEILTMDPALLKGSQFIGIVAKLLASISETEEGAEWLFSLPRNVRRMAFQGILKQIGRVDDVTACSESAHALAQLLLYTDPDTDLVSSTPAHSY